MTPLLPVAVAACAVVLAGCNKERTEQMDVGGPAAAAEAQPALTEQAVADDRWVNYGDPVLLAAGEAVPVSAVLADPSAYEGQEIVLEGKVAQVCPKKGCWVRIGEAAGAEETVFVKLTCPSDDSFIVPPDTTGQTVRVSGKVVMEEVDEATARHLAEDAGASEEELAAIVGPQQSLRVQTPGVLIERGEG